MVALPALMRPRQGGQGLVEYALILVLVVILAIAALAFIGGSLSGMLHSIGSSV